MGVFPSLNAGNGSDMRNVGGILRCKCGLVLRAKELKNWAANKGNLVNQSNNNGIYVVYQ